ncbi:MAG: flagellar hook capping FlgD N-terminal domain-containing protein [Acidimicrobiales bacterium]
MTVNPVSASQATTAASSSSTTNPLQSLTNPNTFLNLLVAQLKYQDPLNPTSGTQFLSQTAQLTEVETISNLQTTISQELASQQTATSTSMIGQQVNATLADGTAVSGKVTGVSLDPTNGPVLDVNGTAVPLSAVQSVGTPPPSSGTTTTSTTSGSGTGSSTTA